MVISPTSSAEVGKLWPRLVCSTPGDHAFFWCYCSSLKAVSCQGDNPSNSHEGSAMSTLGVPESLQVLSSLSWSCKAALSTLPCLEVHSCVLYSFFSSLLAYSRHRCIVQACRLPEHSRWPVGFPSTPLWGFTLFSPTGMTSWLCFVTRDVIFLAFQPDLSSCLPTSRVFCIPLYKCEVRAF